MSKLRLIRFKLPIFMMVLLIIPLFLVGYMSYQKTEIIEKAVIQKSDIENMSNQATDIFSDYENTLTEIAGSQEMQYSSNSYDKTQNEYPNLPEGNDPDKTAFYESYLKQLSKGHDYLVNLYMGTSDGALYLDNIPPEDVDLTSYDPRTTDWYTKAMESNGDVVWTDPYIDTATSKSIITLAKTVVDGSGNVIGVVGMDFEMSKLATLLRHDILKTTLITAAIAIVIGLAIVWFFVRNLVQNVQVIRNGMKKIEEGDLTGEPVFTKSKDELSELAYSVNSMKDNLYSIVKEVSNATNSVTGQSEELTKSANEVKEGSQQIASTMQELTSGTETQADSTTNLAELMEQFSGKVQEAYANGEEVSNSSTAVLAMTDKGSELMRKSVTQMNNIDSIVREALEKVRGLDEQSKEISTLVSVIKDIADQTNLLALNAAIEAARAGENGKGFAVVADEVRKLAEQVSHSVQDITGIVGKIQSESNGVATSLEDGYKEVDEGSKQIRVTGETFENINQSVTDMVRKIQNISENLKGISANSVEMTTSIDEIASISEESAAGVEQVAASAQQSNSSMENVSNSADELKQLADELNKQVIRFKL
ncbi:methyl-accepting chemotaxis protein [Radiobacillus kanasensis]|uniref:methyl-accepting chemotaxis protein n=1 Tax=Radiobacillus kanasensis TaxID=2844358 RepID=UPI001E484030|nr:methyl-accepting chemotaxis protein [Radiobacillus kanasensis]UFU00635.1 methyl-accepting chemotaxis protein [Radiobacillus kanasensis]